VDPVPVSVLQDMGADFIIAVNVMPRLKQRQERVYLKPSAAGEPSSNRGPNIFSIMLKVFGITNSQVVAASLNGADVIIEPCLSGIGLGDFTHTEKCIMEGGLAAIDAIPEIKKKLAL
jgi:NTE family protein